MKKVPTLNCSLLSNAGFSFIISLLCKPPGTVTRSQIRLGYVNWREKKLSSPAPTTCYVTDFDLLGVEIIWNIALQSKTEIVGSSAISFLVSLLKNVCTTFKVPMILTGRSIPLQWKNSPSPIGLNMPSSAWRKLVMQCAITRNLCHRWIVFVFGGA